MTGSPSSALPPFAEHRVQRDGGCVYVRDFPGGGPAFIVLHGFPDNSHIYDHLIPHLVSVRQVLESGESVVIRLVQCRFAGGLHVDRGEPRPV